MSNNEIKALLQIEKEVKILLSEVYELSHSIKKMMLDDDLAGIREEWLKNYSKNLDDVDNSLMEIHDDIRVTPEDLR